MLNQSQKNSKLALTRAKLRSMHSELSYGLSFASKLQRVATMRLSGSHQPTPDPSFSRKYKPTLPGRLFYTDIARPFPPTTPHRYRYSLVLVDDHSRFKFGMLGLVARSDAPAKLTRCVARLNSHASSNAHITPLSRLHSDAAGEFRAAAFLDRWPTTSTRSSRLRRSIS